MYRLLGMLMGLLLTTNVLWAQPQTHNQLLYRSNDTIYIFDAATGETTEVYASDAPHRGWSWSPDGRFILGIVDHSEPPPWEDWENYVHIYDVGQADWLQNIDINVGSAGQAEWSPDSQAIAYGHNMNDINSELWLFSLHSGEHRRLVRTLEGTRLNPVVIGEIWWSPSPAALLFVTGIWRTGGSTNYINLLNLDTEEVYPLYGAYYASFYPQWSPDGKWILLQLKQNYTDSTEGGDVYVFSAQDGTSYQLTETPEIFEQDIRWSLNGDTIQFTTYQDGIDVWVNIDWPPDLSSANVSAALQVTTQPIIATSEPEYTRVDLSSPDGKYAAGFSFEAESEMYVLYVAAVDGSQTFTVGKIRSPFYDILGWRPS